MAGTHRASSPDSASSKTPGFRNARTNRWPGALPQRRHAPSLKSGSHSASRPSIRRRSAPLPGPSRTCCESAFGGTARDSDLLVPAVDLSACFPDAAARFIAARSGTVRCGVAVRAITIAAVTRSRSRWAPVSETFAGVVVAVGPHQLAAAVGGNGERADAWSDPARANRPIRVRIDHHDLSRAHAPRSFRGPDAPPRRCARPVGVRPQRRAGKRCAAWDAGPGRGRHQRKRTARRAQPGNARRKRRIAAAAAWRPIFLR